MEQFERNQGVEQLTHELTDLEYELNQRNEEMTFADHPNSVRLMVPHSSPMKSVLTDMQSQIQQIVEFQRNFDAEIKVFTRVMTDTVSPEIVAKWSELSTGSAHAHEPRPSPQTKFAQAVTGKSTKSLGISEELLRFHSQVKLLEEENARLQAQLTRPSTSSGISFALPQVSSAQSNHTKKQVRTSPNKKHSEARPVLPTLSAITNLRFSTLSLSTREKSENAEDKKKKGVFADRESMLEHVVAAAARPDYDVANYYYKTGYCQQIARNPFVDGLTMTIIFFNSIWMAIDLDLNPACSLVTADPVFQIGEHFFCSFFVVEWLIRFGAFQKKRNLFRDPWMVFDGLLAIAAVLDTWIVTLIAFATNARDCNDETPGASMIRIFKLVRLCRTARMMRLLRRMPELMIMIKGILTAMCSVFFTLVLLFIINYVFGLVFRQLTDGTDVGEMYFDGVLPSMSSLLVYGTLPDQKELMLHLGESHILLGLLAFIFVLLSGLTVLNMLIGVLVEVVGVVASVEKEEIAATFLGECVTKTLLQLKQEEMDETMSRNSSIRATQELLKDIYAQGVDKTYFVKLLTNSDVIKTMQKAGIDVVALADLTDFLYKDTEEMPLKDLLKLIMQMRGANTTTVKDIIDLRKFILQELSRTTRGIDDIKRLCSKIDDLPRLCARLCSKTAEDPSRNAVV